MATLLQVMTLDAWMSGVTRPLGATNWRVGGAAASGDARESVAVGARAGSAVLLFRG